MTDSTAALLEAMRRAWPSHTEGSGGTNTASGASNTALTYWQVLDPALPSAGLAVAILVALDGWTLVPTEEVKRLRDALEIIATPPERAPYAIPVTARNIARAALEA